MDHKGDQMKISKLFSALFGLLGTAVAVCTVLLCLHSLDQAPVLTKMPVNATSQVDKMFHAVCSNDYAAASALMYGTPDLGADPESCDIVTAVIWEAFVDSMDYELVGDCYATESGVAQKVRLHCMDVASITGSLQTRARALLEQRIEEAEEMEDIYDENNDFRQDFVDTVVAEAAAAAAAQDATYTETELTVNLTYTKGQWWILADDALIQALSGGMVQ